MERHRITVPHTKRSCKQHDCEYHNGIRESVSTYKPTNGSHIPETRRIGTVVETVVGIRDTMDEYPITWNKT